MDIREYLSLQANAVSIGAKIDYLEASGIDDYRSFAARILGLKLWPNLSDNALVEQGFAGSFADLNKKSVRKNYYVANCLGFLKILSVVATDETKALLIKTDDDLVLKNYYHLFMDLLFDSIYILSLYRIRVEKTGPIHPMEKSRIVQPLQLWHFAHQCVFGQASGHSCADREPEVAVAVIRLAIEVRLRRATGILGKRLTSNPQDYQPVKLSNIIEAIARRAHADDLPVPIQNIKRIYKWANEFVHGGTREAIPSWLPLIALEYLKPFLLGHDIKGSWNTDNGFRCSSATLEGIRHEVLALEYRRSGSSGWFKRLCTLLLPGKGVCTRGELVLSSSVEAELTDP